MNSFPFGKSGLLPPFLIAIIWRWLRPLHISNHDGTPLREIWPAAVLSALQLYYGDTDFRTKANMVAPHVMEIWLAEIAFALLLYYGDADFYIEAIRITIVFGTSGCVPAFVFVLTQH